MTVEEFLTDPQKCARGNIDFTEEFGVDYNLCINGYILYGCGPEIGCHGNTPGQDFPGFTAGPLQTEADLAKIMFRTNRGLLRSLPGGDRPGLRRVGGRAPHLGEHARALCRGLFSAGDRNGAAGYDQKY